MTSTSVSDAVHGIGAINNGNTAKKTENAKSKEYDFGKIMNQVKDKTKQTAYQSEHYMTEKKAVSQPKESSGNKVEKTKDDFKTGEPDAKKKVAEKESTNETSETTKDISTEPVDEETKTAVEDTVKEIMEEVEETLDVSEEELLEVMQQLGLAFTDLLKPDNLAAIMTALTGEDTSIQLVMDEDMYLTFQDLIQMMDEKTQQLLDSTGLSEEELEAVLDQLKLLIDQQISKEGKDVQILSFEQLETTVEGEMITDAMADESIPVVVEKHADLQSLENKELSQEGEQGAIVEIEAGKETGKNEETLFQQQQQNMQGYQNMVDEMQEIAQESKMQSLDVPNTESILKQLADYIKIDSGKELTEMELQLHPASLGNVRVLLSTKGGVVTAQLTTENEVVKNAIESQVSQLKLNLEEQGVKVEAIEVSVASHQMERNLEQNAGEHQNQEQTDKTDGTYKIRRTSINLNSYENEEELVEDIGEPDDATKIAMEMMAIGGNRMDLLA